MKEVAIYRSKEGKFKLDVNLTNSTVWLNLNQLAELFQKNKSTISRHIDNIIATGELKRRSVVAKYATTAADGKTYQVEYYNLDMIISVGYRVNSKRGVEFRIWATNVIKRHLIHGYTVNKKRLLEEKKKLDQLVKTIDVLKKTVDNQSVKLDDVKDLIKVIADYSHALDVLDGYDHQSLGIMDVSKKEAYRLNQDECMAIIKEMEHEFNTGYFGKEMNRTFESSISTIYQTFDGKELYPSVEEKAANLLYLITKNHSFIDGNKRIAAAIFLYFLGRNRLLYKHDGSKRLADNAIAALTLMIAESRPEDKSVMTKVVVNLINRKN